MSNLAGRWIPLSAAKFEQLLKEAVMTQDRETLEAALLGYGQQLAKINEKIKAIRQQLHGKAPSIRITTESVVTPTQAKRHQISAEGRARIAAAQRKRWALSKKAKAAA